MVPRHPRQVIAILPLYARMPGANLVWESDVLRP